MTPQQRLHDFLVGAMREIGREPAVFFGQDQREKEDMFPPVIVYALDGQDTIPTDDGEVVIENIYAVQVSSRTETADSDLSEVVLGVLDHASRSDEITVMTESADRDDDLAMSYQELEVRLAPYDSELPLVQRHTAQTYGDPPTGITFNGQRLVW